MNAPVRAFIKDTLASLISGMGGAKDKSRALYYTVNEPVKAELDAMYRGDWIARKIVKIPAEDATREWRQWQAENDQIESIEDLERRFSIPQKVCQALIKSRLYGGAALVLGIEGTGPPDKELDLERVAAGSLSFVHVVSRYDLSVQDGLEKDLMSPWYGRPIMFTRQVLDGDNIRIHPSRVITFNGEEHPDPQQSPEGWGDSILMAVRDAIMQAGTISSSVATLMEELKIDVLKIEGLTETLSDEEATAALTQRLTYGMTAKSTLNSLVIDKNDEWERLQQNFTSFPDVIKMYMQLASGAADIPVTRMLGQSPTGLNATGESDIRNYYDKVASYQHEHLSLAIDRLDEVVVRSALGSYDPNIFYEWNPLWQTSEVEKADLAAKKANTFKIDVDTMMIPSDALRIGRENQLIEDATYPGFEKALEESDGKVVNPKLEAQMALQEQAAALAPPMPPGAPGQPPGNPFKKPPPGSPPVAKAPKKKPNPFAKDAGFNSSQARNEAGRWELVGTGGSHIGPLEKHTSLREYTPSEMDWEYDREYMRYTRPSFPDAFASREDFQAQYDAAPIVHLSLEELHNLGNSMASAAYGRDRDWMEEEFGHRRDVGRIYDQMEEGGIPPPIVLQHETGLHLMAGQTRLAAALAVGKTMPVKLIPVTRKKRRNIIDTHHTTDAGYDEDQPRDDQGRWAQTVAALRELRRKHRKTVLLGAIGAGIVAGTVLGLA